MNEAQEVLETLDLASETPATPVESAPAPETPPATPPAEPAAPVVPVTPVVEPASPPATPPAAPVEPTGLPGEPPPAPIVPPVAVPAAPVVDPRDQELEAMRAQIVELSKRLSATPVTQQPPAAPIPVAAVPATPPTPAVPTPAAAADIVFFKDEAEVNAALETAGGFNKFLNNFVRMIEPAIVERAVRQTVAIVPEIAMNAGTEQITTMSTVKGWYDANPDLVPFKEFCGVIAKEVITKDRNITMDKALEQTEKEVRSRLRLVKPTVSTPVASGGAPPATPGFTPGGGAGPGAPGPVLDKVQKDIADTIY